MIRGVDNITVNTGLGALDVPNTAKNSNNIGVICGLDMDLRKMGGFMFNFEARFADENAVSGSLSYNF